MNRSSRPFKTIVAALALSVAIPAGCDSSGSGVSGETHFVSCSTDADCASLEGNYSCIEQFCLPLGDASVGCVSGRQISCACPGGSSGIQVCLPDGTAYGSCTGCGVVGTGGGATGGSSGRGGTVTDASAGGRADGSIDSGASMGGSTGGAATSTGGTTTNTGGAATSSGGHTNDGSIAGSGGVGTGGAAGTGGASGATGGSPSNGGASGSGGTPTPDSGTSGVPVVLASGQKNPGHLAVDAVNVYWVNRADGVVMRVAINGGQPVPLASGAVRSRAIVDTSVYWTTSSEVMKAPKGGGTPEPLASGQNGPDGIAVDATSVYWLNAASSCSGSVCTPTHVMKTSKAPVDGGVDGGGPTTLATLSVPPYAIAVDGTSVYWTNNAASPTSSPSAVNKVALTGGTPAPVAFLAGSNWGTTLAVDSANVYWVNVVVTTLPTPTVTSSLMRAPIAGGQAVTLSHDPATGVVVDGTHVYWIGSGGVIKKALPDGRVTTQVATTIGASRLAVDATSVYWTNSTDGTVMRLTPK